MMRKLSAGIVALVTGATLTGMTGSAHAAAPTGAETCPALSLCLYYNSPNFHWGSFEHWPDGWYPDLSSFTFSNWGNGSGYGVNVAGNAAAVVNNTGDPWQICNATGVFSGPGTCTTIPNGYADALPAFLHNHDWSMTSEAT